jgi:hypothetical protein
MRIIYFFELLEPDSLPICNVQSHVMMENKDLPIVTGLETGTSSSTISHSRVPDGILVMLVSDQNIISANYSCLKIEGMVALSRLGETGCDISMYVSAGLPVPLLLGTPFIYKCVREIACYAGVVHEPMAPAC